MTAWSSILINLKICTFSQTSQNWDQKKSICSNMIYKQKKIYLKKCIQQINLWIIYSAVNFWLEIEEIGRIWSIYWSYLPYMRNDNCQCIGVISLVWDRNIINVLELSPLCQVEYYQYIGVFSLVWDRNIINILESSTL